MIEIESDLNYSDKKRQNMVSLLAKQISESHLMERVILHSFDWVLLSQCEEFAFGFITSYLMKIKQDNNFENQQPGCFRGFSKGKNRSAIPAKIFEAGGLVWCPHFKELSEGSLSSVRKYDLLVFLWTVNETTDIDMMINLGVDAIVTDTLTELKIVSHQKE